MRQRLRLLACGALPLVLALAFDWTRQRLDPRDWSSHQATIGPQATVVEGGRRRAIGREIASVPTGQPFAWTSVFCVESGVAMIGSVRLVGDDGADLVPPRESYFPPEAGRCGPLQGFLMVPASLAPQPARLLRMAILIPPGGAAVRVLQLPTLKLEISP